MSGKPVRPRALARRDVEAAVDYYAASAGTDAGLGFIVELQATYRRIAERPRAGSPRYGHALALAGLRSRSLKRYPYVVFYLERDDHIDVWRVRHARRDMPAAMRTSAT